MLYKITVTSLITCLFSLSLSAQNNNDSLNCCSVNIVRENIVHAIFKSSIKFEKLIQAKFTQELKHVNSFEISIDINRKGYPKYIYFYADKEDEYFNLLKVKAKKYILDSCRWKPAYSNINSKRFYIAGIEDYIIQ